MSDTMFRKAVVACLLLVGVDANAAIVIAPDAPVAGQPVRISIVDQYTSAASVTSASIIRNGQSFVIEQTVDVACSLPAAPVLTSAFDVGPLPAGSYNVVANVTRTTSLPGCVVSNETQNGAFQVAGGTNGNINAPQVVPTWGSTAILALMLAIGTVGAFGLRRQD